MTARKLAHNTLWNLAGQVLPLFLAVAVIPLLIKGMGVSRYGFLTLAWVLIGYAGLFDFGISRAMTRLVAKHFAEGDDAGALEIAGAGSSFMVLFGSVVGTLLFLAAPAIVDHWLKVPPEILGEAVNSLRVLAFSVPVVLLTGAYRGILEAHQEFKRLTMIRLLMGALTYLGPLAALAISARLEVVVGTIVVMRFVANYLHARLCRQAVGFVFRWKMPDRVSTRRLFALGGWMSVSNIVSPIMSYMDRFILGGLVAIELVAYYATPYDMITKVMVFPTAFMVALFPVLAGMSGDLVKVRQTYTTTVRILFILMWPFSFGAIVLAYPVMHLWLGATFAEHSAPVLQLLAIGVFANTLAQAPANLIQSIGQPKWMAITHLIELPLFLLAIYFFTMHFGLRGTAFAWAMRMSLDAVILFVMAGKKLVKPDFSRGGLILTAVISGAALLAGFAPYSMVQSLAVCAVGLVGFVVLSWCFLLTAEDKQVFLKLKRLSSRSAT